MRTKTTLAVRLVTRVTRVTRVDSPKRSHSVTADNDVTCTTPDNDVTCIIKKQNK